MTPYNPYITSYSYNAHGIIGGGWEGMNTNFNRRLGLGWGGFSAAQESEVLAPSEMFTVADSRTLPAAPGDPRLVGFLTMSPYNYNDMYWNETAPLHGRGYNILFADGHVALVKRIDYLFPPRTGHNWNRDNQPHPEAWPPTNQWVIQN